MITRGARHAVFCPGSSASRMTDPATLAFWTALAQIVGINVLLSGDNAVAIALACRSLPPHQQRRGVVLGTLAAILLRIVFAAGVVWLLAFPYLKLAAGVMLLWVAIQLMQPEDGEGHGSVAAQGTLLGAVRTIIIADAVMSLDNVIGIAAAARGDMVLLVLGLALSIPLVVWGSSVVLLLLRRFPVVVTLGAALLGWVAGGIAVSDPALVTLFGAQRTPAHVLAEAAGAMVVVLSGWLLARAKASAVRRE